MLHALSRHSMLLSDDRYINLLILLWATVRKELDLLKIPTFGIAGVVTTVCMD